MWILTRVQAQLYVRVVMFRVVRRAPHSLTGTTPCRPPTGAGEPPGGAGDCLAGKGEALMGEGRAGDGEGSSGDGRVGDGEPGDGGGPNRSGITVWSMQAVSFSPCTAQCMPGRTKEEGV